MKKQKHSEAAWMARATSPKGEQWFALTIIGTTQKDARESFTKYCFSAPEYHADQWALLRKEGWKIVPVKILDFSHD